MAQAQSFVIEGPAGALQARLEQRDDAPGFVAVVCHPHPLHGGTMDNKVVTTLVRTARDKGAAAVRFNFRGVGDSAGQFDNGDGETQDLLAVIDHCRDRFPGLPLWLAGFSFGSWVAANACQRLLQVPPEHLLLVAPPVHHAPFDALAAIPCPVTVVQGLEDEVVPVDEVLAWVAATPLAPELVKVSACGHFFHGQLPELAKAALATLPEG